VPPILSTDAGQACSRQVNALLNLLEIYYNSNRGRLCYCSSGLSCWSSRTSLQQGALDSSSHVTLWHFRSSLSRSPPHHPLSRRRPGPALFRPAHSRPALSPPLPARPSQLSPGGGAHPAHLSASRRFESTCSLQTLFLRSSFSLALALRRSSSSRPYYPPARHNKMGWLDDGAYRSLSEREGRAVRQGVEPLSWARGTRSEGERRAVK